MSAVFWHQFCGHGENFTAWKNGDLGHCFEQIVVVCPSHMILSVFSAYYIAAAKYSTRGLSCQLPWFVKFRLLCIILLSIITVSEVVVTRILNEISVSYSDITTSCVVTFTWIIHAVYIYKLKYLYWSTWRGATPVVIIFILPVISIAAQLHTNILQRIRLSPSHNVVEEYHVYCATFLILCYLFTLIPNWERVRLVDDTSYGAINEDVDESTSLLHHAPITYSSLQEQQGTAAVKAEENVNLLSLLSFHWVQSLLSKGASKSIQSVCDMFLLPDRLNTSFLFNKFTSILSPKQYNQWHNGNLSQSFTSSISSSNSLPEVGYSNANSRYNTNNDSKKHITLFRALNRAYGFEYYSLGILKLLADCLGFAGPILLNLLVTYMEKSDEPEKNGYIYAAGLFGVTLLGSLFSTQFDYNCQVVGLKIRTSIITTIYRKSLSVSNVSVRKFTTGQITNFMSTDTDRIVNFCPSFHAFWSLPFQVGVSLYLLHQQVGLAFLAGLAFALILIPINRWLAIKIGQLSKDMMEQKDGRVKVMNEVLFGMQVVKLYAWESHFESKINRLRDAELKSLKGRKYLDALCVYFWATTPVLISILTFTTYTLMGNQLTAAKVFTSLSLFLMLISPLNAFPWVINGLMEAWVSLKRVEKFVDVKDLDLEQYYSSNSVLQSDCAFLMKNGEFSWKDHDTKPDKTKQGSKQGEYTQIPDSDTAPCLFDINIQVMKGQLIGVIGKVGSGKSSILSSILAEMYKVRGHVRVNDLDTGFALVCQEPWIQHATVRENILFGQQYNRQRYERVLEACALLEDLKTLPAGDSTEVGENGVTLSGGQKARIALARTILPAGDSTEVGENGVTLSGGQKARVALARAVYQNKDTYLLDDPLAAVDAHVAQHLYQKCIMGMLADKTRILCTHHTKFLVNADLVILLEDGRIVKSGKPADVLSSAEVAEFENNENSTNSELSDHEIQHNTEDGTLTEEEEKETGVVKLDVYKTYWRAVGACLAPSVLVSLFLMQASRNINDWWLSYWVSHSEVPGLPVTNSTADKLLQINWLYRLKDNNDSVSNMTTAGDDILFYLTVYGCLAGANSVFTLFRAFLFAYGGICAAQTIHKQLLTNILKAPISFFDVTPIGRIVNRFSSDVFAIDDSLPFIMNIFLAQMFGIFGTIVVTCYGLPWFAILLIPLGLLYYKIQNYYRHTSREIKRISSVTLSPIYAHFSETITGLTTIRAMREQNRFQRENLDRLDMNQRAQFAGQAIASWLSFRLQMLGVAMVTGIAFIAVLEHHFHTVNPGLVGLAISYALAVTNLLSGVVSSFAETEKQMVSVERAQQYIENVPNEIEEGTLLGCQNLLSGVVNLFAETEKQMVSIERAQQYIENVPNEVEEGTLFPPPYWPIQGSIVFRQVKMKYRHNLPDALNKVSFEVEPAEKVGIVGRTGSGKSSLFLALFRMVEIYKGNIFVDGIDLIHLDLKDIRSKFAIIPQDPFLFSGSVRENLDPTTVHTDNEIWTVLDKCHLREAVNRLGGLSGDVGERGHHLSVGQKQLVCLARALLTRAKIICVDEATASVDMETDILIQQTIRTEFVDSTVLTIAHRINTIMDSDRVLVMSDGHVAEFAPPGRLLQNQDSLFYGLVHGK